MKLIQKTLMLMLLCMSGVNTSYAYNIGDPDQPITGGIFYWQDVYGDGDYSTTRSYQFGDCNNTAKIDYPVVPANKDDVGGHPWMGLTSYWSGWGGAKEGGFEGYLESWNTGSSVGLAAYWPGRWWIPLNGGFTACVKGPD
jgi:hypothetical protein